MKNLLFILAFSVFLYGCYEPSVQESKTSSMAKSKVDSSEVIMIAGSTTMLPILRHVSTYFLSKNNHYRILFDARGSNKGIEAIWHDSADIAMSSHQMSDSMINSFQKKKVEFAEFLLAGDALVFIVNINNEVKKLTSEHLKAIYTGEITNWKQLGGKDGKIHIYSRDYSSGTYSFFRDQVLVHSHIDSSVSFVKDSKDMVKAIAKEKNAIGYISFSNLDYSVDPLNVSFDGGKSFVSPRIETINNLKYKYFRGLYLYYKPEVFMKIRPFLDSVKSDTVQKIIRADGYIPLSHKLIANH